MTYNPIVSYPSYVVVDPVEPYTGICRAKGGLPTVFGCFDLAPIGLLRQSINLIFIILLLGALINLVLILIGYFRRKQIKWASVRNNLLVVGLSLFVLGFLFILFE